MRSGSGQGPRGAGSIDAECDFGSSSAGLKLGSKVLRPSDQSDRMYPLFKSLRVRNQKKTPKMEFSLGRLKMAGHPVIGSFGHSPIFFGHPRENRISLEMDGPAFLGRLGRPRARQQRRQRLGSSPSYKNTHATKTTVAPGIFGF